VTGRKIKTLSYTYYWESYYRELVSFFESIEKDLETPITALDGLKTIQVIEEAYSLTAVLISRAAFRKLLT